jgi:hypothetical protein
MSRNQLARGGTSLRTWALVLPLVAVTAGELGAGQWCKRYPEPVGLLNPNSCFGYFQTGWSPWHAACGHPFPAGPPEVQNVPPGTPAGAPAAPAAQPTPSAAPNGAGRAGSKSTGAKPTNPAPGSQPIERVQHNDH